MPDPYNAIRVERGRAVAEKYHDDFGDGDRESAFVDLVADLMHAIHTDGFSLDAVLLKASSHFCTESGLYEDEGDGQVIQASGDHRDLSELIDEAVTTKWKAVWQQKPYDSHSRMIHEFTAADDRDKALAVAHLEIQRDYGCVTFTIHTLERLT